MARGGCGSGPHSGGVFSVGADPDRQAAVGKRGEGRGRRLVRNDGQPLGGIGIGSPLRPHGTAAARKGHPPVNRQIHSGN